MKEIMGLQYPWCKEIIAQFYATMYFEPDMHKTVHWLTNGLKFSVTYTKFAAILGFPVRMRKNRFKIHSEKPMETNAIGFMYNHDVDYELGTIKAPKLPPADCLCSRPGKPPQLLQAFVGEHPRSRVLSSPASKPPLQPCCPNGASPRRLCLLLLVVFHPTPVPVRPQPAADEPPSSRRLAACRDATLEPPAAVPAPHAAPCCRGCQTVVAVIIAFAKRHCVPQLSCRSSSSSILPL
ncbi:hypothetical protein E2562_022020, partial [Oryza meyeriana var. granulata]